MPIITPYLKIYMKKTLFCVALAALTLAGCSKKEEKTLSGLLKSEFQKEVQGKKTDLYVLKNKNGVEVCITNFGGKVVSIMTPDKNGKMADIVLCEDNMDSMLKSTQPYFGATIGRYGNRIANAKFKIDSTEYTLAANNNGQALHGGPKGFHAVVWDAKQIGDSAVELSYLAKDGEEGYPGNLNCKVVYTLTSNNELKINYEATTDKPTVVNLTHHSFFNLAGEGASTINDHVLTINADKYNPVDSVLIPTGELADVTGTPFDFRKPFVIGQRIDTTNNKQMKLGKGYDHNWIINQKTPNEMTFAAKIVEPKSGRVMEVYTTEPGIQFYGGNFLNNDLGKAGHKYPFRSAFCLETQHFPDSPNKPQFPSTVLRPGQKYAHVCVYKFSVEK